MNEQKKISEAEYFLGKLNEEINNQEHYLYNLSAFLSSARSVLQYALEEAKTKTGGQAWYNSKIQGDKILKFFKDKRDLNIHTSSVTTTKQVDIQVHDVIHISESLNIIITNQDGNIVGKYNSDPTPIVLRNEESSSIRISYKFDDWGDNEHVSELCTLYLQKLKDFVSDGQVHLYLT